MVTGRVNECSVTFPSHFKTLRSIIACIESLIIQLKKIDLDNTLVIALQRNRLSIQVQENKKTTFNYNVNDLIQKEDKKLYVIIPREGINAEIFTRILTGIKQTLFEKMINGNGESYVHDISLSDERLSIAWEFNSNVVVPFRERIPANKELLLLIDGSNMLASSYFATSYKKKPTQLLQTKEGLYTNGIYTMLRRFLHLCKTYKTTHLAICWDISRSTFRRELYPEYKGNRSAMEPELKQQFGTAQELFKAMGVAQFAAAGFEADDLIGVIQHAWIQKQKGNCYIVSTDQDLYQLLNEQTEIIQQKRNGDIHYTLQSFQEEFNLSPGQWVDLKAFIGDTSDNIPGVKGVGLKTALPLIQTYQNIDGVYQYLHSLNGNLKKSEQNMVLEKDIAYLSKQLATVMKEVPELEINTDDLLLNIDSKAMVNELKRLEFHSIIKDIQDGKYKAS